MECRSCGASLPTGATTCPQCQASTPYNIISTTPTEANPYEESTPSVVPAPTETTAGETSTASTSHEEASDIAAYRSVPPPPTAEPPVQQSTPSKSEQEPSYAQPAFYQQSWPQALPASTPAAYSPMPPGPAPLTPEQPGPGATTPTKPGRARLWLSLLTLAMIIIVTALALLPVFHGLHPSTGPSGNPIYADAAAIIADVQTASDINTQQVTLSNRFKVNAQFYIILTINPARYDFTNRAGYFLSTLYFNGQSIATTRPQAITTDINQNPYIVLPLALKQAGTAAAEFYWCTISTCDDQRLARYVAFTITN